MTTKTRESVYRSMKRLYKRYIRNCRQGNVFWELTQEEFQALTGKPCHYCGKPPAQVSRAYTYNGIDRMDPKKGYLRENVVPCCKECNWIKGNRLTSDEMKVIGDALTQYRKKRG